MPLDSAAKLEYPLHWAVFMDEQKDLKELLANKQTLEIDKIDPRGRTAVMLAVTIRHFDCARLLLEAGADASIPNKQMWSLSNEAAALKNEDFLFEVIHHRDYQRATRGARTMKNILERLNDVPDFFCEMNWDFSSWVPFLTQICPSDCYNVYKKGSSVRIDTTLASFDDETHWVRVNQSFVFRLNAEGFAEFVTIDHDEKVADVQALRDDHSFEYFNPIEGDMAFRMNNPISTSYIDVDNIGFERTSRGFLSWFTSPESTESVQGYECKVLSASNVHLVTKRRMDHLSANRRAELENNGKSIDTKAMAGLKKFISHTKTDENTKRNLLEEGLSAEQYFYPQYEFEPKSDIGSAREVERKSTGFKATLWMADDYPLNLNDQIVPIVELMAVNSSHFARLHKFIRLQLPAGFPIKIEIPLFHIVSARVAFQNVNVAGKYVTPLEGNNVFIEDAAFQIPAGYSDDRGGGNYGITWADDEERRGRGAVAVAAQSNSEELSLQLAIEQSLREASGVNSVSAPTTSSVPNEDQQLAELLQFTEAQPPSDTEFFRAIRDSQVEADRHLREQEQFELELKKVLELSKTEQ